MFTGLPALSHEQQQQAVERIHQLMSEGLTSGQAIAMVAEEIRSTHTGGHVAVMFDDEDDDDDRADGQDDEDEEDEDDY
ncbi:YoaH family protein [Erwinia sp. SLM-02]|uniref:YoaH family protein n=1 Tax=Erwinia sp. SLM-02 TaxID=3020057 RepID=UPI0028D4A1A5|nr:YoaH family protein [uncultured Erwinia sp.]